MYLFELQLCLGTCLEKGLLGHMVTLFLVFWGTSILFSIVATPIYIPTNGVRGFSFFHTFSNMLFISFLIMVILSSVRWYLFIVLIGMSLIMRNDEPPFMCLLAICMSSLEKCLFRSFAHFFYWVVFFWLWVVWAVCIFWKLRLCWSYHTLKRKH